MSISKGSDLRSIVKVLLEDKSLGPAMVKVNPVVDPSAALTDPANPDFKPTDRAELKAALSAIISDISDDSVPGVYDSIKNAIDVPDTDDKGDKEMSNTKVEAVVRAAVRKLLRENYINEESAAEKRERLAKEKWAQYPSGEEAREKFLSGGGQITKVPTGVGVTRATTPDPAAVKSLRSSLSTMQLDPEDSKDASAKKNMMVSDTGGEGLKELAAEFGFKNPNGVLQWINKVVDKMKVRLENFEQYQVAVLEIMNQFLDDMSKPYMDGKKELPPLIEPEDVELMKSNPELVEELPLFREYLSKQLKKRGL